MVVTNRCNIRCAYCNFPLLKEPEMTLEQIETVFTKLKRMGVIRLGLLGGEPLYRRDFPEILSMAKRKGFFVSVNSNLLLYEKHADTLRDADYFFTSLDGPPDRHIKNRGKQDYEKVLTAIRDIRGQGKPLTAICVITDFETEDAEYLLALAREERFTVHFQPECFDTEIVMRSAKEDFPQEKARRFWKYILKQKQSGAPIASSESYLQYIISWKDYRQSARYVTGSRCAAGRGYIFIDASGTAYPCAYTKGKTPGINLLEDDWEKSFNCKTPCTECIVGPMLEFNLLFQKPISSIANILNIT
ncbi:MAG: radical SAM protein [Chitinophagales bacterium]|nr:radical SAM protein [Chitinophagales bacterium]MDW8417790.1 radical SAM protein [Chitinophagales bacterium]